jgi:hypothetical protein
MTPHWGAGFGPAEARAVLEALGVLDHDGSVVVRGTPVGLGQYTRGLCPTLGMLADDVVCAGPLGHALCGGSTRWQGREVCPLPKPACYYPDAAYKHL